MNEDDITLMNEVSEVGNDRVAMPIKSVGYDTELTAEEEEEYQKWRSTLPKSLRYEGDYDLRGYWKDPNTKKEAADGAHFTDKYKKPNHPTFSTESKYAVGENLKYAGSWDGEKYVPSSHRYGEPDDRARTELNAQDAGRLGEAAKANDDGVSANNNAVMSPRSQRKNLEDMNREEIVALVKKNFGEVTNTTAGMKSYRQRKRLDDMLELSDRLEKMATYVVDQTEDDEDFKDVHNKMVRVRDALGVHKTKFANLSNDKIDLLADYISREYDAASKRRGFFETTADAFNRGYWSAGNMVYQGFLAHSPTISDEDAGLIKGSMKAENDLQISLPKKISGVENIHSIGDAIEWFFEGVGENATRMAIGTAFSAVGSLLGGPAGAIVVGSLGTMALNTGEAVQDYMNEEGLDADIRNGRGYVLAQGLGYSLLDGAFGVDKFGGKIWSQMIKRMTAKKLIKGATVDAVKDLTKNATLKHTAKNVLLHGVLGEGLQEAAQSQGVGRGVRYFRTGSIYRKKEDGSYETAGDAFLEGVNEFAGGAALGLAGGAFHGTMSMTDARRAVRILHETQGVLKDEKMYKQLPEYAKLLVDRHVQNDRFLSTNGLLTQDERRDLEISNAEIDAEIERMGAKDNPDSDEKITGQSARLYLDLFKSQYALEDMGEAIAEMKASGKVSDLSKEAMEASAEERTKNGQRFVLYTDKGISIAEMLDKDGKPTGVYTFNNDPERKSPIFGKNDLVCKSFGEAFEHAQDLDLFNQWREQKLQAKAEIVGRVFNNLFGNRGIELRFVDRPTAGKPVVINQYNYDQKTGEVVMTGTKSVAGTTAAYDYDKNGGPGTVEVSLDNIDSLGSLYTSLIHERSHEDIVEFLLKSGKFTKQVGSKTVIDWEAFEAAREELMSKVDGAEEVSSKFRKKGAKPGANGRYSKADTLNDWGRSAGIAGEEMVVERSSVIDLMNQLRREKQGVVGGLLEKIRYAIGMRMAADMGLDIREMIPTLNKDVAKEMNAIFKIGYVGKSAPKGFTRGKPGERVVVDNDSLIKTPEEFAAQFGEKVAGVNRADVLNLGDNPTAGGETKGKPTNTSRKRYPQLKDGDGEVFSDGKVIRRADGKVFTKVSNPDGTYVWRGVDGDVSDSVATEGGYEALRAPSAKPTETPKPTETRENAPTSVPQEKGITSQAKGAEGVEAQKTASTEAGTPKAEKKAAKKADEPVRSNPDGTLTVEQNDKPKEPPKEAKEPEVAKKPTEEKNHEVPPTNGEPSVKDDVLNLNLPKELVENVNAVDELLDNEPSYSWVTKEQRESIKNLIRTTGVQAIGIKNIVGGDGVALVKFEDGHRELLDPGGTPMTIDEIVNLYNKIHNTNIKKPGDESPTKRFHSLFSLPQIKNLKVADIPNGSQYSGLSADRLLYLASHNGDKRALREMFFGKFVKGPSKKSDGKLVKWFLKKGVKEENLDKWINRTWADICSVVRMSLSTNDENNLSELRNKLAEYKTAYDKKIEKLVDLQGRKKKSDWNRYVRMLERNGRSWQGELNELKREIDAIRDFIRKRVEYMQLVRRAEKNGNISNVKKLDNNPLGVTIPAEALVYDVANGVVAKAEMKYRQNKADEEASNDIKQNEKSAELATAEKLTKQFSDDVLDSLEDNNLLETTIANRRAKLVDDSRFISDVYKDMDISELAKLCFPHDGVMANRNAQRALLMRAEELTIRHAYSLVKRENIPSDYADQIFDGVITSIERNFDEGTAFSFESEDDFNKFVYARANNFARRAKTAFAVRGDNQSLDARVEVAGNAAEASEDDRVWGDERPSSNEVIDSSDGVSFDEESDKEKRKRLGFFATASEAADAILASQELNEMQRNILKALMDAWLAQINAIDEAIENERKGENRPRVIENLNNDRKRILNLDSGDKSTINIAAESLGMLPRVYRARLSKLLDRIEWSFVGKGNYQEARKNQREVTIGYEVKNVKGGEGPVSVAKRSIVNFLPDAGRRGKNEAFAKYREEMSEGRFTPEELSDVLREVSANKGIPLKYDENDLILLMSRNGDIAMARAVEMARRGETNEDIDKKAFTDIKGKPVLNDANVWTADSLLDRAFSDYGWIDPRLGRNRDVKIVAKILATFNFNDKYDFSAVKDEEIANALNEYQKQGQTNPSVRTAKELAQAVIVGGREFPNIVNNVRMGLSLLGLKVGKIGDAKKSTDENGNKVDIDETKLPNIIAEAVSSLIRKDPLSKEDKNRRNRELESSDYGKISQMMAENGNDEATVRKALQDNGESETRINSMFTHFNSVNKKIANAEAKRIQRNAEMEETGSGLSDGQKEEIINLFKENDFKDVIKTAEEAVEKLGLDDKLFNTARDFLYFYDRNRRRSNEESLKNAPYSTKREIIVNMLHQTGDDYISDDEAIKFGVNNLGMNNLTVGSIIRAERPPEAKVATHAELAKRDVSDAKILSNTEAENISRVLDMEDRMEAAKEKAKKLEEAKKTLKNTAAVKNHDFVQRLLDNPQVGNLEKAEFHLRNGGLSEKGAKNEIDDYNKVEAANKVVNDSTDKDSETKRYHTRTITFEVNGAHDNSDITTSGDNLAIILKNAMYRAIGRREWLRDRVELRIKEVDGKVFDPNSLGKYATIYGDELKNGQLLEVLSRALGIRIKPGDGGGDSVYVDQAGNAVANDRVAKSDRGNGRRKGVDKGTQYKERVGGEDEGEGRRGDQEGQDISWYRSNGIEPGPDLANAETMQRLRNGDTMRFHTRMSDTDDNAIFATQAGMNARGFNASPREYVADKYTDAEADKIIADRAAFGEVVKKGLNSNALTDIEMRALVKEYNNRVGEAISKNLDGDLFKTNDEQLEAIANAVNRASSTLGAALRQLQIGLDARTKDSFVYLKSALRAHFKKQLEEKYGLGDALIRDPELEAKVEEYSKMLEEQAAKLQAQHDEIDALKNEIAKKEAEADDRTIDELIEKTKREAYEAGMRAADEAEKERRLKGLDRMVNEFDFDPDLSEAAYDGADALIDLFGDSKRFAGNPKVEMTEQIRNAFAMVLNAAHGDVEKARKFLAAKATNFKELIEPSFNQYIAEVNREAAPKDGLTVTKEKNRKRIIEERAQKASIPKAKSTENFTADAKELFGESADTKHPHRATKKNAVDFVTKMKNRASRALAFVGLSENEEEKLAHLGDCARSLFKLSVYLYPEWTKSKRFEFIARKMNEFAPGNKFEKVDAAEAIIGAGRFKPISRDNAKATYAQLKKALKLLQEDGNKVAEAAKIAGIEYSSKADIIQELDRRLGSILDKRLNVFSSRINEDADPKLEKDIHDLILAIHDIRNSNKSIDELLGKYLNLAIGMKDYRKQRSVLDRINSRIEMYERKIAENDFDPPPKRETPDTDKEIKKIYSAMRELERLRERHKHERDISNIIKKPWLSRQLSALAEILGETKAVVGSLDLSSVLRQGGQLTWAHPILASKNIKKMLKAFANEDNARSIMDSIMERPNAKYYLQAGIDFTDYGINAANAEDLYMLNKFRLITNNRLAKWGISSSERAFSTFLNLMRADVFDAMVASSPMRTADNFSKIQLKAIGNFINIASQRGAIDQHGKLGKALNAMNAVLWSPRNIISRFQFMRETMMLPLHGLTSSYGAEANDAKMRAMFAKETIRYFLGVATAILLVKMIRDLFKDDDEPEEDIVLDPRSSDFLKVKIGNTRLDFMSGLQQAFVFSYRMISGKTTNLRGETRDLNRFETIGRFLRSKFAPGASIVYDTAIARETFEYQDISWRPLDQLKNDNETIGFTRYLIGGSLVPLSLSDLREQAVNGKVGFLPVSWLFTLLGAGVQSFDPYTYKQMSGDYRYFKRLYRDAETAEEREKLVKNHPMLKYMGAIDAITKEINRIQRTIKDLEKQGKNSPELENILETRKKQAINLMAGFKNPMQAE